MDDREQQMEMARNPQVGDWWHDHWCPQYLVVAVDDATVTLSQEIVEGNTMDNSSSSPPWWATWAWVHEPKNPVVMSRDEFVRKLTYSTMPDKLWARCVRRNNGPAETART